MANKKINLVGISTDYAQKMQEKYGKNELSNQKEPNLFIKIIHIVKEPMFILLMIAAVIYFVLGEFIDGAVMVVFVVGIISIDVIQQVKTDKTLTALRDLSAPQITVVRDGEEKKIKSVDLVPQDLMLISEGVKIPADGYIIKSSDLCVDESSLTGESQGVYKKIADEAELSEIDINNNEGEQGSVDSVQKKDNYFRDDYCYAGTLVTQGSATILVDKIGLKTEYGKIGLDVMEAPVEDTPLQKQTGSLVKICAVIAAVLFVLVATFTYLNISDHSFIDRFTQSILSGVTLAMAMIPEEYPVILTVFLSMGAWRLAKKQSLVRNLPSVETLGAVSVLCVDKTGTITTNQMTVQDAWSLEGDQKTLIHTMGLGCEIDVYDPMEKAMLKFCEQNGFSKDELFKGDLISEYTFKNELKMMGHVWALEKGVVVAAKGSTQSILGICDISDKKKKEVKRKAEKMSKQGFRVIAVGRQKLKSREDIASEITECNLEFLGLISLLDPPKQSVKDDIEVCNRAGIRVVMITGDNGGTASAIAKKVGIKDCDDIITGDMLYKLSDQQLAQKVKDVNVFSRVVPQHKMRIVKAFKDNGEIVAMTGDGVNDAPALKHADIGIAMGKRGSEVSREASDLILMDDNFTTIVETVKDGRRIYDNIRKAIGYVFAIHIPIAMASLLGPIFGIESNALLLLPIHVVLLELIIDPTCSVVLERRAPEPDIMDRKPRDPKEKLLNMKILTKSVLQGLMIFVASFSAYIYVLNGDSQNATIARSFGLSIIILSNIMLVLVNSKDTGFIPEIIKDFLKDKVMWISTLGTVFVLLIALYSPINGFFKLAPLRLEQFAIVFIISAVSVLWYEIVKLIKKLRKKQI